MMNDVVVSDVMEKETALPPQEVSVGSRRGSTLKGPCLPSIVREMDISVLQICDHSDYAWMSARIE